MVAGFQPGANQNPLPRAAGRFDHHPPLAAPGGPAPRGWNNPQTPAGMPQKAPASPADALMTSVAPQKGHPCGGNGLKSTLSDPPGIFQRVESETIPLQEIPLHPAKRGGTRRSKPGGEEAPLARRKKPVSPQYPSSSIPQRQSPAGTHWGRIVPNASGAAPEGMR